MIRHQAGDAVSSEALGWVEALVAQCEAALAELRLLVPWATLPADSPGMQDLTRVAAIPSLRQVASLDSQLPAIASLRHDQPSAPADREESLALRSLVSEGSEHARNRLATLERLTAQVSELAQMDYDFLFDHARRQLAIGYNVSDRRLDSSFYDLLASEARLANFVAIAQGKLSQDTGSRLAAC